jgi:tetratricopeptide (TPR) repeat protein
MRPVRLLLLAAAAALCLAASGADAGDDTSALAQSLAAAEERLGSTDPGLLEILAPLAELRFRDGEIAAALALRRRSLDIAIGAFGSDSPPAAAAMTALAFLYIDLRRYLDAEPLLIAAGNILATHQCADDASAAAVLSGLARIALARGDKEVARARIERAIAIDQAEDCGDRSDRLRTLGAVLAAEERFDESDRVLEAAVALDRAAHDEAATARSLAQLANTLLRAKRVTAALPLIEEATALDQSRLGPDHPFIVDDFYTLGLAYLEAKRPALAQKALDAAARRLDRGERDRPREGYVKLALSRALHEQGREQEAAALFAEARRILNTAEEQERERERVT